MALSDFRIGTSATQHAGTGTLSVSTGTTAVTGSGTAFTTELHVGDVIIAAGQTLSVAAIADATHLTLALAVGAALSSAAFAYNPLVNVETLFGDINAPKPSYISYVDHFDLGDGTRRGVGRPRATWSWGLLSVTHRDLLRAYCPGDSARVYVRTRRYESADGMATFTAVVLWPAEEQRDSLSVRVPFGLEFRNMVLL
jgi:hypothetical protein